MSVATYPLSPQQHVPVMLHEVVSAVAAVDGDVVVDGTYGAGGYSRAVLNTAKCRVIAIDRDPNVHDSARSMEQEYQGRFTFISGCFGEMESLLRGVGITSVQGVMLDIGVSSMQLDEAQRGFSFRFDGPLDMRMSQSGQSAADVVNTTEESELADIIYTLGEERASRKIAKAIVMARSVKPIETTGELANIVRSVVKKNPKDAKDPATRTFQALRIHVNAELDELSSALSAAEKLLDPSGRLAVVTFHSLEDRIVKQFMHERSRTSSGGSRYVPELPDEKNNAPTLRLIKPFPLLPTEAEIQRNARARSAKLRAAIRTEAPVFYKKKQG
jgi:16S rRNA (cytosine1402-N4)-methyltransferase